MGCEISSFDFGVFHNKQIYSSKTNKSKVNCVFRGESVHVAKNGSQGEQCQQELGAGGQIEAAQS